MTLTSKCTFQITGWEEKTYQELIGGAKLTQAKVTQTYSGGIEGTSSIEYLMAYTIQGTVSFVGLEKISGTLEGKAGSFVIQHVGTFSEGKARSSWSIIPGSGTDDLVGLQGQGTYVAGHGEPALMEFSCYL